LRFRPILMDDTRQPCWRAAADAEYRRRAELRRPLGIGMVGGLW
jgi:multidrug efflux pump subunit AcrB